jgi:hypothetical protein
MLSTKKELSPKGRIRTFHSIRTYDFGMLTRAENIRATVHHTNPQISAFFGELRHLRYFRAISSCGGPWWRDRGLITRSETKSRKEAGCDFDFQYFSSIWFMETVRLSANVSQISGVGIKFISCAGFPKIS